MNNDNNYFNKNFTPEEKINAWWEKYYPPDWYLHPDIYPYPKDWQRYPDIPEYPYELIAELYKTNNLQINLPIDLPIDLQKQNIEGFSNNMCPTSVNILFLLIIIAIIIFFLLNK